MHRARPTIQSILGCRRSSKVGGRWVKEGFSKDKGVASF